MSTEKRSYKLVTVCAECLCASCWQGIFMCQKAQFANVVQKTRKQLRKLNLENPCYWKTDTQLATNHI